MKYGGLSWLLTLLLVLQPAFAQAPGAEALTVSIIEGEGAMNNIAQPAPHDVAVRIDDSNGKLVVGAVVSFSVPTQGASGTFLDGHTTVTVTSDAQGKAVARGFRPNTVAGKLGILVNASWRGRTARTTVTQFNMLVGDAKAPKKAGSKKLVTLLLIAGAAAAGGAVAATQRGKQGTSAPSASTSISITPGSGSVAGPE